MENLKKLHLEVIKYEESNCITQDGDYIAFVENHNYYDVAVKSAEITKDIAFKFLKFIEDNYYYNSGAWVNCQTDEYKSREGIFEEFLKTL